MERITSLKNPKVQGWKALKERKGRRESGCFLVEGFKMVEEALASSFTVEAVLAQEDCLAALPAHPDCPVYLLPAGVLAAVCDTKTPQGVAAVVRMAQRPAQGGRLIALDGVQDPGNVGTLLRSAAAFGFDGVLLSKGCAAPFAPKTLRASMGAAGRLPVAPVQDLPQALQQLRARGVVCLAAALYHSRPLDEAPQSYPDGLCAVIGSEGQGLTDAAVQACDMAVRIPMTDLVESLNAGVAGSVLLWHFRGV